MSEQQTTEWGLEARWVKLSEREPGRDNEVFARNIKDGMIATIKFFEDGPMRYTANGESFIWDDDEVNEIPEWEWLELRPKEDVAEPVVPVTDGRKKLLHDLKERMIEIEEMRRSEWNTNIKNFFKHDDMDDSEPVAPLPDGRKKQLPHDSRSLVYESYLESLRENEMGIKQLAEDHEMFKDLKDLDMLEADEMDNSEPVVPVADERPDWLIGAERWYEDMRPFLQPIVEIRHDRNGEFANLAGMFELQAELNEHLDASMIAVADEGDERDIAQWTQNLATAMQQELAELVDCVPWKWWANYQKYDRQNARVEIVDLFHFLISMAQLHGMTAQDVFEAYKAKCEINHKRHESGYTEKDPDDCKCI